MKRLLCLFLAFCLIAGLSGHIQPARADGMTVASESGIGEIPKDAFTGGGEEYTGEDGSVTTVYNNGSMRTVYPDGTSQGIDYNGNLYRSGANGETDISCLDGSTAVIHPDDKLEHKYADGSYEITNPDGSTVTKNSAGLVIEKDAEGNTLSFGFENGAKIEMVDGQPPEGDHAITGPNGETLTMHFDPSAEDMDLSVKFEGNGQKYEMTAQDGELEIHCSDPDGTTVDGHMDDKNLELSMKGSNGDAFNLSVDSENGHMQMSGTVDGEAETIDVRVSEDGSGSLTVKNAETDLVITGGADGSMDLRDNRTGARSHYGQDGVDIRNADGTGIQTDAEGNVIWADVRDEKGNQLFSAKDGVMTFADPEDPSKKLTLAKDADGGYTAVTPDGDAYRVDPDGTVTKNGVVFVPHIPSDDDFTGCYYGSYTNTYHWDNDSQSSHDSGYFIYKYNDCYYAAMSTDPTFIENMFREMGAEAFFNSYFDGYDLQMIESSFDSTTNTAMFIMTVRLTDYQYLYEVYTLTFSDDAVTIEMNEDNVYKGDAEPNETHLFTGTKK